jgi:hydroxypyruvate isomerase
MKRANITRRELLRTTALGTTIGAVAASTSEAAAAAPLKGRLKQSVCKWCYKDISLEDLCKAAAEIGLKSIDLLNVEELPVVKQHGLICAMVNGPGPIRDGWNETKRHDELVKKSEEILPVIAEYGYPNMIVFSGDRREMSDKEGIKNCAKGLKRITPLAEKLGVTICMELLNSKRDHKDYMCDHTAWGVALAQEIGSPRFKLLYDIYHMQIMEGDVIATLRENKDYIAHYHTGGVPGRHEIDETQELQYKTICQAIVDTGFDGYLAQEFIPARDPLASLAQAARICDV